MMRKASDVFRFIGEMIVAAVMIPVSIISVLAYNAAIMLVVGIVFAGLMWLVAQILTTLTG